MATLPGCGVRRARLHGVVKYKDKPLGRAIITFFGSDSGTYSAITRPDGTYDIANVPQGSVTVSVQIPPTRPKARPHPVLPKDNGTVKPEDRPPDPPPEPPQPPWTRDFPARYRDPNTSGLSVELKEADQEYSIDLK